MVRPRPFADAELRAVLIVIDSFSKSDNGVPGKALDTKNRAILNELIRRRNDPNDNTSGLLLWVANKPRRVEEAVRHIHKDYYGTKELKGKDSKSLYRLGSRLFGNVQDPPTYVPSLNEGQTPAPSVGPASQSPPSTIDTRSTTQQSLDVAQTPATPQPAMASNATTTDGVASSGNTGLSDSVPPAASAKQTGLMLPPPTPAPAAAAEQDIRQRARQAARNRTKQRLEERAPNFADHEEVMGNLPDIVDTIVTDLFHENAWLNIDIYQHAFLDHIAADKNASETTKSVFSATTDGLHEDYDNHEVATRTIVQSITLCWIVGTVYGTRSSAASGGSYFWKFLGINRGTNIGEHSQNDGHKQMMANLKTPIAYRSTFESLVEKTDIPFVAKKAADIYVQVLSQAFNAARQAYDPNVPTPKLMEETERYRYDPSYTEHEAAITIYSKVKWEPAASKIATEIEKLYKLKINDVRRRVNCTTLIPSRGAPFSNRTMVSVDDDLQENGKKSGSVVLPLGVEVHGRYKVLLGGKSLQSDIDVVKAKVILKDTN